MLPAVGTKCVSGVHMDSASAHCITLGCARERERET